MTAATPQPVISRQTRPHPGLAPLLERRRRQPYAGPVHPRSIATFGELDHWLRRQQQPLILDAGCGTGTSSIELARRHPDHAVIGIDKSAHRLARRHGARLPPNCRLARADLIDIWRLAIAADWQPARHYLLYPNPWPKPKHLARRWHAHPVLPWILALGGHLELRTNWRIYAEEFARTLGLALERRVGIAPLEADPPLTPFERKYRDSGQRLWRCRTALTAAERQDWSLATRPAADYNQLVTTTRLQPATTAQPRI